MTSDCLDISGLEKTARFGEKFETQFQIFNDSLCSFPYSKCSPVSG